MHIEIVQNGIDRLRLLREPGVDTFQELHPVGNGASRVGLREGLASRWSKGPKDIALAPPPIIDLLPSTLGRGRWLGYRGWSHQCLARKALGRFRTHLIQADHDTTRRWARVECFNAPLFLANSGSTRSPNQVSCVRQRRPSAISRSSIRLRLMAMTLCSFKYAASRSNVHEANGNPRCSGGVSEVAMTSATCGGVEVAGRPERGLS